MKTILALFVFFTAFSTQAQTISEQIGGVSSDFEFYSDSDTLDVIKQLLIERPTAKSAHSSYENESYGFGYAYSDWRLEFISNTKITSRRWTYEETRMRRGSYEITLRNQAGGILVTQYIGGDNVHLWEGKLHTGAVYTYSVNLSGLPLIILDNVSSVSIVLVD